MNDQDWQESIAAHRPIVIVPSLVYLAGPITGCDYGECTDWRKYVANKFPSSIQGISPMRGKDYLSKETSVADHYPETILSTGKAITTRDHYDCKRCDMIFANLLGAKKVSIGTVMEIAWGHSYNKPIVLVMEKDNIHNHSMIRETAGFIVDNIDDAIDVTKAVLSLKV